MSRMTDVLKDRREKFKGKYKQKRLMLKQFANKFYRSRFNRDENEPIRLGEDINDSHYYRLFAKQDIEELLVMLVNYFRWFITNEDYDYIYLSDDLVIFRDIDYPHVRKSNSFDINFIHDKTVKAGDFYVTHGKYVYSIVTAEELKDILFDKIEKDERRNIVYNEQKKIAEERNKKHGKRENE